MKPNSKRQRALDAVNRAQAEVGKALSLLGGRTRYKPKHLTREFTSRQYLESISQRLYVISDLLVAGESHALNFVGTATGRFSSTENIIPVKIDDEHPIYKRFPMLKGATAEDVREALENRPSLRDDFEQTYDKERNALDT